MANDIDVLTFEEAMQALSNNSSRVPSNSDVIERLVTAVSQQLDDLCGPIVIREIEDEVVYPENPYAPLALSHHPVVAVTSLTEYVNGTGTVLTAEDFDTAGDYLIDRGNVARRSGFHSLAWNGPVKVTYTAGRFDSTEDVDAKFKRAAEEILIGAQQKYGAAWARGGDPLADPVFFDEVSFVVNNRLWAERVMTF